MASKGKWKFVYTDLDNNTFALDKDGKVLPLHSAEVYEAYTEVADNELFRRAQKYEAIEGNRKLLSLKKVQA